MAIVSQVLEVTEVKVEVVVKVEVAVQVGVAVRVEMVVVEVHEHRMVGLVMQVLADVRDLPVIQGEVVVMVLMDVLELMVQFYMQ